MTPEKEKILGYKLSEYYRLNSQIKELNDAKNRLNKEFKDMLGNTPGQLQAGGFIAKLYAQDKSRMNEEKTLELLRNKDLTDCIKIKETIDEEALEAALYRGEVSQQELDNCVDVNIVLALTVKREGESNEPKSGSSSKSRGSSSRK